MVHQGEEAPCTYNVSALLEASFRGDVDGMKAILAANPTMTVNDQDYDNRSPLHLAAAGGRIEAVKFLIESGAVLKTDRFGMLPLHDAVMNDHPDICDMLAGLDLFDADGMCYLSPSQLELLKDQLGSYSAEISLTVEELEAKMKEIFGIILKEGVFAARRLWIEIQYYFIDLGLHPKYFKDFTSAQIARHIHSLLAARKIAQTTKSDFIHFEIEEPESAFFLATLDPSRVWETERKVVNYISHFRSDDAVSMVFMRSGKSPNQDDGGMPLGIFIVNKTHFQPGVIESKGVADEENIKVVASERFLQSKTEENQQFYQSLVHETMATRNAVVRIIEPPSHMVTKAGAKIVQFAAYDAERRGRVYLLEVNECLRSHDVMPKRMYVESFANGIVTYHMYFDPVSTVDDLEKLAQTLRYASHFKHSPKKSALVWDLVLKNEITPEHAIYLISAAKFVFSFFPKETHEYLDLVEFFKSNQAMKSKLDEMFLQTMSNSITYERIYDALSTHYALTLPMFEDFSKIATGECKPFHNDELERRIDEEVWSRFDGKILKTLLKLNAHLQMTNFFKAGTAAAIAMRFDGRVVSDRPKSLFPVIPHAVYLIVGRNFYGFHIRFRDIARGGIRMILSRNRQVYSKNCATLLEENYNLALTQQLKNKDIPEGGSKGTILLDLDDQHLQTSGRDAFNKYIDALLDCMMCEETGLASHLSREEILFFGPDENTAGFMDLGAYRAKARGYPYWKALTTGKSTKLGGVPHDKYGMTTNSIHEYVLQLLDALDIQESSVTKVMTGGPDGDLGSNEILISKDNTIAICDGSGVLYDPEGLNRDELTRLARERIPVSNFDRSKLSANPKSFLVTVDDADVTLPNGQHFKTGVEVRNTFTSLEYCSADLFVPCGGRPATVNMGNVQDMFHPSTKQPKFKFIVEGANLFFTDDARRVMEDAGVHLFKDSSTNKGGVTSSSLEVFAALCMAPNDHEKNLTVKDPNSDPPEFYEQYAQEIISVIRHNAKMEFNAIWTANHEVMAADGSGFINKIDASAMLSRKINHLKAYIMEVLETEEPDDQWIVRAVLRRCVPRLLLVHCGLDGILERTPEAYILAMVATWIANTFVYKFGLNSSEFAFYQFMRSLEESSGGEVTPASMERPRHLGSFSL